MRDSQYLRFARAWIDIPLLYGNQRAEFSHDQATHAHLVHIIRQNRRHSYKFSGRRGRDSEEQQDEHRRCARLAHECRSRRGRRKTSGDIGGREDAHRWVAAERDGRKPECRGERERDREPTYTQASNVMSWPGEE